jgi:hypothetical protein
MPNSVVSWAARTEQRKDAGRANIGDICPTEDAAMRPFAAAAPPDHERLQAAERPGAQELGITHLDQAGA